MTELESLMAKGDLAGAKAKAESLLEKHPQGPQAVGALVALGKIALVQGQLELASGLIDRAEAQGKTAQTLLLRANLHAQQGALPEAEVEYRRALSKSPELAEAHFGLGMVLAKTERMEEAVLALEKACALQPQNVVFAYRSAQALLEADRFEQAIPRFQAAVALAPKFVPVYLSLSHALARRGDLTAARKVIEIGLQQAPEAPRLLSALTNLSLLQGDVGTGQRTATQLANARPDDPDAQANLALLLLLQGKLKDALFIAQRMSSVGTSTAPLKMVEAACYEAREPPGYSEAIRAYEEAMALDLNGWRAASNLGQLLLRMPSEPPGAQVPRAVTVLEEAHRRKPDQLEPMLNLALACMRAGDVARSRALAERLASYQLPEQHPIRDQALRLLKVLPVS